MKNCFESKTALVGFVEDIIDSLELGYVSITIIRPEKLGDFFVITAIEESSEGIQTETSSSKREST